MIAGVGLLVVVHPFQETKLVGYTYCTLHIVASIQLYSSTEHHQLAGYSMIIYYNVCYVYKHITVNLEMFEVK